MSSVFPEDRVTQTTPRPNLTCDTVPDGSITATNGLFHAAPRWRTTRHGVRESRVMP